MARVRQGEEIIIAKAGKPLVRMVPIDERPTKRIPGIDQCKGWIADDFDAPCLKNYKPILNRQW